MIQRAYSVNPDIINLNNGSVCPSPRVVQDAMLKNQEVTQMQPSYYVDEFLIPHAEIIRKRLAALFGCHAEEMAITRNATESLEIIQLGLPLKPGDEVLTTTQDYPRNLLSPLPRPATTILSPASNRPLHRAPKSFTSPTSLTPPAKFFP